MIHRRPVFRLSFDGFVESQVERKIWSAASWGVRVKGTTVAGGSNKSDQESHLQMMGIGNAPVTCLAVEQLPKDLVTK